VASYLDARHAAGQWLIRVEDVDSIREVPGSIESILEALHTFRFYWDEPLMRQSARSPMYEQALDRLRALGLAYPCSCSRAEIQAASPATTGEELRYPGWCRKGVRAGDRHVAWRFRVPDEPVSFADAIQGNVTINVAAEVGDFVIRRRDGLFAYQLAVVIDDAAQGITHVVRGADLLTSTPRQLLLQNALGLPKPAYAHVPVATDDKGVKLSKSAGAGSVDLQQPRQELWRALRFLRQEPPAELRGASLDVLWAWAIEHWRLEAPRNVRAQQLDMPDPPR
jgi:glutamyl-Q tRNA(Asp) synthetase